MMSPALIRYRAEQRVAQLHREAARQERHPTTDRSASVLLLLARELALTLLAHLASGLR
jgi:hypothetical protein